jgi:hypothetical protein
MLQGQRFQYSGTVSVGTACDEVMLWQVDLGAANE